jgi:hypothetical protein
LTNFHWKAFGENACILRKRGGWEGKAGFPKSFFQGNPSS